MKMKRRSFCKSFPFILTFSNILIDKVKGKGGGRKRIRVPRPIIKFSSAPNTQPPQKFSQAYVSGLRCFKKKILKKSSSGSVNAFAVSMHNTIDAENYFHLSDVIHFF